jgi:hypothetical protein
MPEQCDRVETWRIGAPWRAVGLDLWPVECVAGNSLKSRTGLWFSLSMQPRALLVRDADGLRVVAVGEAPISLNHLRAQIPQLDALLARGD